MYKPYKLNSFWEAAIAFTAALAVFMIGQAAGVPGIMDLIMFLIALVAVICVLEYWLPRYRFGIAARKYRADPDKPPKATGVIENLAELVSEGPDFDPVIGKAQQYSNKPKK